MKIDFYLDVFPGCTIEHLTASTMKPYDPIGRRLKFTVDVPDWMLVSAEPPSHIVESSRPEEPAPPR